MVERLNYGKKHGALFWNTHAGAGLDLFWQAGGQNWGVEFKYEVAPRLTRSMKTAYPLTEKIRVIPLAGVPDAWNYG